MSGETQLVRLFVSLIQGLRIDECLKLEQELSCVSLNTLVLSDIEVIIGRTLRTRGFDAEEYVERAEHILDQVVSSDIIVLHCQESGYPRLLREIYDPPYLLYVKGHIPVSDTGFSLAVVGTREASSSGMKRAYMAGLQMGFSSVPLISGLARGIDTAGHQGAVDAAGRTWAVVGSGFNRLYPKSSYLLVKHMIYYGGGIISEFPPDTVAQRWHFPKRNRIISGLSNAVYVVEAPQHSGALITVDFALDQGRDVYVDLECSRERWSQGTARLAEDGARCISSLQDVVVDNRLSDISVPEVEVYDASGRSPEELLSLEMAGNLFRYTNNWFYVRR